MIVVPGKYCLFYPGLKKMRPMTSECRVEQLWIKKKKVEWDKNAVDMCRYPVLKIAAKTQFGQVRDLKELPVARFIKTPPVPIEEEPRFSLGVLRTCLISSLCTPAVYKQVLDIYEKAKLKLVHAWAFPLIFNNAASFKNAVMFIERLPAFFDADNPHAAPPEKRAAMYRLSEFIPVPPAWAEIVAAGHLPWYVGRPRVALFKMLLCAHELDTESAFHRHVFPKDVLKLILAECHLFVVAGEW